ncbi:hypothetical protein CNR22_22470 [Sphingobacteriaceae bacterium]|nr:hypothetical protein CNR22_22470 [Sphingobacteriaceae bacterium]
MKEIPAKIIKILFYIFLLSSFSISAQIKIYPNTNYFIREDYLTDNKKLDSLDRFIDSLLMRFMQDPEVAGISIGILKKGESYFYNYGEIKKGSKILADKTTIYEIGALTTSFTGLLLTQAILEKTIDTNADIRDYLPGKYSSLEVNRVPILVKHLANHTSGLATTPEDLKSMVSYDSLNPYASYSKEMILSYLKNTKPKTVPGSECNYSNVGMAVLGIILEEIYKKSFNELVAEKICLPLGLKNTSTVIDAEQIRKLSTGYNQDGNFTPAWKLGGFEAAGSLKSNTEDLLLYLDYLLHQKDKAARIVIQPTFNGRPKVATTWYLSQTKKKTTLISQSGVTYGFGAFSGFIPEKNCAVVLLSNTNRSLDFLALALFNYLQK